jgi:hypothetical protein
LYKENLSSGFGFTTGTIRYADLIYLVGTRRDLVRQRVPHSRLFGIHRGQWGASNLDWLACSMTVTKDTDRLLVLGVDGQVLRAGGGEYEQEIPIGHRESGWTLRGPLREIRAVPDGGVFAVGMARQVFQRLGPGRWNRIDEPIRPQGDEVMSTNFESVDGFDSNEVYTVGWEGEIWWYDGSDWHRIDSPTNLALYKIRCGGDGIVYACGQAGTLLRGRHDRWEAIDHDVRQHDFWGLAWFEDKLFLSTTTFVYELVGDQPARVDYGDDPPLTCYHLDAACGLMLSVGAEDVMIFDGSKWSTVD